MCLLTMSSRSKDSNVQMSLFHKLLRPVINDRNTREHDSLLSYNMQQENAPDEKSAEIAMRSMFGTNEPSAMRESQRRLWQSHKSLAYPSKGKFLQRQWFASANEASKAASQSVSEDESRGVAFDLDILGLRWRLWERPANLRPANTNFVSGRQETEPVNTESAKDDVKPLFPGVEDLSLNIKDTERIIEPKRKSVSFIGISPKGPVLHCIDDESSDESHKISSSDNGFLGSSPSYQTPLTAPLDDEDRNQIPCDAINCHKRCRQHRAPPPCDLCTSEQLKDLSKLESHRKEMLIDKVAKKAEAIQTRTWPNSLTMNETYLSVCAEQAADDRDDRLKRLIIPNPLEGQKPKPSLAVSLADPKADWIPHFELRHEGLPKDKLFDIRGGLNSSNIPYYMGRLMPGPGQAPKECQQIGFTPMPEEEQIRVLWELKEQRDKSDGRLHS